MNDSTPPNTKTPRALKILHHSGKNSILFKISKLSTNHRKLLVFM
jgi:hypothetical protein